MLQKLQTAPRDRTSEAQWSKVFTENGDRRAQNFGLSIPRLEYLIAAAAGLLILVSLTYPIGGAIVALAIVAAVVLPWAIYYTSRHVSGLLIVLVLIEAIAASYFAANSDQKIGAMVRYPLNLLFILPFIPSLWKSGILRQGGFRDYAIYLTWALVSVSYSILPAVSIARAFAAILPFLALCAIVVEVRSGDDARRAMGVLLAGCGTAVAATSLAILIQPPMPCSPIPKAGCCGSLDFSPNPT